MKIVICGMSGFVGNALGRFFKGRGDEVVALSIRSSTMPDSLVSQLDNSNVIINLAGANIMGRWSPSYKETLRESRLKTTAILVDAVRKCTHPPHTWLNASAIGIYDSDHQHDEYSHHFGGDFLSRLVQDWEYEASKVSSSDTRVCMMRFGVVYGSGGGAMEKMLPPFKMGLGGKMGDGFQMVSWIHLDDLVRACAFLIERKEISGPVNFTAPEPISNLEQTQIMGRTLKRPIFFDLPAWLVKLIFGEGSSVMLDSKEVYPRVLQEKGFAFLYPTFGSAMEEIVHEQG